MSGLDPIGRREVRDIILELKEKGRTVFFSTHVLSDAEMLCDRVAVLAGGKLQGIGSPAEILSMEVQGMEILCDVPPARQLPAGLVEHAVRSGNRYHIRVPEAQLYDALAQLQVCEARILSVAPLRPTLEDYFIRLVEHPKAAPPPAVVSGEPA
jgi:ABC-2 type transport system ATP-binding protein